MLVFPGKLCVSRAMSHGTSTPPLSANDATKLVHDCSEDLLCSPSEILGLINTLDAQTASGPDGISVKMLKATAKVLVPQLPSY